MKIKVIVMYLLHQSQLLFLDVANTSKTGY